MRILVCGGRDYSGEASIAHVLSQIYDISCLIEGGAKGADRLARQYAKANKIPVDTYQANWKLYGKSAGPIRNKAMLMEGAPDLVIAFPGGPGTANMVSQAQKHGTRVYKVPIGFSGDVRGIGQTTFQIRNAPMNARFICPAGQLFYIEGLAAKIGRTDLGFLVPAGPIFGIASSSLVVDHACVLTQEMRDHLYARGVKLPKQRA